MAQKAIWDGTSFFQVGQTPFKFYDQDPAFALDADKVADFCATRLGYPILDVELRSGSFYACFEEAISTYGAELYQFKIRENYINLEGSSAESPLNNVVVRPNLTNIIEISKFYGLEAGVNGAVTKYSGSLSLKGGKQNYDLKQWAIDKGIEGGIEVRKIFYQAPPAIMRYFDPYAGTGTGIQSLMDAFDFGSYSPGINFLLMPASFDIMKLQAIEFNDQIRKSAYSFEIVNNELKLFPVPVRDGDLIFEYFKLSEKKQAGLLEAGTGAGGSLITDVSNVPYEPVSYQTLNIVSKQWIFRYTLALARELLAYVRGKYTTIPIPGSEATLNQQDLLADARSEKTDLLTQLREMLGESSRRTQLQRQAEEAESTTKILKEVPFKIYVG
jgi:hypothetical protein